MELKILAKNTAILASPKILKFFVGIIRSKLVAVFLGLTGLGIIDQLTDIINRIKNFTLTSLPDGMVKLIAEENGLEFNHDKIVSIIKTYMLMIMPLIISVIFLGYIFSSQITLFIFGDLKYHNYFRIGFAALPITILATTARSILKAFKDVKALSMAEMIIIVTNLITFVPLVYYFDITGGVIYVTLSFFVTLFVFGSLMYKRVFLKYSISFRDIRKGLYSKAYFKELLGFLGFGIIGGSYYTFTELTSRSLVVNNLGLDKLGMYAPITKWASLFIGFILPSIYTYLFPRLSEARSDREIVGVVNDVIRLITFITLPFILLGISMRNWIIPLFYSKDFIEAAVYLPFHFSALLFVVWASIFEQIFAPTGRLKIYLIIGIVTNTLTLLLVYYLIPIFGMYGYVAKFTVVPLFSIIFYYFLWREKIKFELSKDNVRIVIFSIISFLIVLLIKDKQYFAEIVALVLIIGMSFLMNTREKKFLKKKLLFFKAKLIKPWKRN